MNKTFYVINCTMCFFVVACFSIKVAYSFELPDSCTQAVKLRGSGSKNYSMIIDLYNECLQGNLSPGNKVVTYLNRGNAKRLKGDLDGSIDDYSNAIQIDSNSYLAYDNRGAARGEGGDLDGAIVDCTKAINLNPQFVKAYINRGFARKYKNDFDGAIVDFTKAISLDPQNAEVYGYRGHVRKQKGDISGAESDFKKYHELNPMRNPPALPGD